MPITDGEEWVLSSRRAHRVHTRDEEKISPQTTTHIYILTDREATRGTDTEMICTEWDNRVLLGCAEQGGVQTKKYLFYLFLQSYRIMLYRL